MLSSYIVLFFLGASLASFFVLVGQRTRLHQSIIFPRSHCSICQHELAWYELVPVMSFISLRGSCLVCFTNISITGVLWEILSGCVLCLCYMVLENWQLIMVSNCCWFCIIIYLNYLYEWVMCRWYNIILSEKIQ